MVVLRGHQLVTTRSGVDDGRAPWDDCKTPTELNKLTSPITLRSPLGRGSMIVVLRGLTVKQP